MVEAEKRLSNPELDVEKVKSVSAAAADLASWIKAVIQLYRVNQAIEPKRALFKQKRSHVRDLEEQLNPSKESPTKEQLETSYSDIFATPSKDLDESGYLEVELSKGLF